MKFLYLLNYNIPTFTLDLYYVLFQFYFTTAEAAF